MTRTWAELVRFPVGDLSIKPNGVILHNPGVYKQLRLRIVGHEFVIEYSPTMQRAAS